jgi:hypothetical protein
MVLPRAVLYRPLTAKIQAWEGLVPTRSDSRSKASADPPDTWSADRRREVSKRCLPARHGLAIEAALHGPAAKRNLERDIVRLGIEVRVAWGIRSWCWRRA